MGIVVGLQRLPVFVGGALALSRDVKNLAQLNVAPDLGPARLAVAIERLTVGVGRRLIVMLQEEHFRDAVVRKRAVLVALQRLVEFAEPTRQVALLHQPLSALYGGSSA